MLDDCLVWQRNLKIDHGVTHTIIEQAAVNVLAESPPPGQDCNRKLCHGEFTTLYNSIVDKPRASSKDTPATRNWWSPSALCIVERSG